MPTLKNVLFKKEVDSVDHYKKRIMAVELLVSLQPFIFFQHEAEHTLSIQNILYYYASSGSIIWEQIAVSIGFNVILIPFFVAPAYFSYL